MTREKEGGRRFADFAIIVALRSCAARIRFKEVSERFALGSYGRE